MIDHDIATAVPSIIEHCGVCYHGLWLSPPNLLSGGSASYYLSDMEVVTRGGRRIKPWHGAAYAEAMRFSPATASRPFLYMHPSAQHDAEDEKGLDRSGYCIFYDASGYWRTPTYLSGYALYGVRVAYTPDSQGQAIPFRFHDRYMPPILVGAKGSGLLSDVEALTHESRELCSVSTDGRLRLYARFPTLDQIGIMRRWYEGTDDPLPSGATYEPQAASYALSGEYGEIVATPVDIAQPAYSYTSDMLEDIGERIDYVSFWDLGPVGSCRAGEVLAPTLRVGRSPDSAWPDYRRQYEKMMSAIDVCADPASPTFLSLSLEIESIMTNADRGAGHAENILGGECEREGQLGQWILSTQSHREFELVSTLTRRRALSLSGWGQESSATAEYIRSNTRNVVTETVDGEVVSEVETLAFERSVSVQLDGQVVLSRQGWGDVVGSPETFPLPRVLRYNQRSADLFFAHTDNERGELLEGGRYAAAQIIKMSFSADGVHALACVVAEGTVKKIGGPSNFVYALDPETTRVRVFIGRIYGFGISAPGRELTEDEMDGERLFIAYDPLEKKFSDIYTHPVYFQ